jgi:hypothetical protein
MLNQTNPAHVSHGISTRLRTPHGLAVDEVVLVVHPVEPPIGAEAPAVVGALELAGEQRTDLGGDEPVPAVLAHVVERTDPTVHPAHGDDRLATDLVRDVVAGFGDLVDATGHLPDTRPQRLLLGTGELGRPVPVASDRRVAQRRLRRLGAAGAADRHWLLDDVRHGAPRPVLGDVPGTNLTKVQQLGRLRAAGRGTSTRGDITDMHRHSTGSPR